MHNASRAEASQPGERARSRVLSGGTEAVAFEKRLCIEHLQEAGYLIDARRRRLDAGVDSWLVAANAEQRLSRHARALGAWPSGAQRALDGLTSHDDDIRYGALFATASLCAGREERSRLLGALALVESNESARIADALSLAAGPDLGPLLEAALADAPPPTQALMAVAIGARGAGGEDVLLRLLTTSPPSGEACRAAALALSQLGCTQARSALSRLAGRRAAEDAEPYLFALALLGDEQAMGDVRRWASSSEATTAWNLYVLLGLQGDSRDEEALEQAWLDRGGADTESSATPLVRAMGALGTARLVPLLVEAVRDGPPGVALAAAQSLERITGAGLLDAMESSHTRRPSIDAAAWQAWWSEHGRRFRPHVRHRQGVQWTPGARASLREIGLATTPRAERQLAVWEVQMHSPARTPPICLEWPVARQQRALGAWKDEEARRRA